MRRPIARHRFPRVLTVAAIAGVLAAAAAAFAPPMRRHTVTAARDVPLVPDDQDPPGPSHYEESLSGGARVLRSNGVPKHKVGRFPNAHNPNAIRPQRHAADLPATPCADDHAHPVQNESPWGRPGEPFGIAVNGVQFDPVANEFWRGDRASGWTYEPLGGAVPLGLDANHAHVQPTGKYHYHGLPTGLLTDLGWGAGKHSPLVGWAADGFPIYAVYGWSDPGDASSAVAELRTSYRLRRGERPGGDEPGGAYDGAFVEDYEYEAGLGDLDECNGRRCVTPEFPEGTYAYFLTRDWPVIPRQLRGEPRAIR